jgi:hypothetical protein
MQSSENPLHALSTIDLRIRSYFTLLPTELLSLILLFYTNSFQGLIAFSCLNKECQNIVNSSLLWLSCDLTFYVSKRYLQAVEVWKPEFVGSVSDFLKHDPAYFIHRIHTLTLSLTLFDQGFKSVQSAFIVTVYRPNNSFDHLPIVERTIHAQKVRAWFMTLFTNYHRLWYWHTRWYPLLITICAYVGWFILEHLVHFVIISLLSLFFCIYCLFSISTSSFLSVFNHIGFILLLVNLFALILILIGYLLVEIIKYCTNNFIYLLWEWDWIDATFPVILVLISTGSFVGVLLSYLQLADTLSLQWVTIVVIMWFFFLLATVAVVFEFCFRVQSSLDKAQRIALIYSFNAIPASCLLAALFSYSSSFSSTFSNGLLVLVPVFPLTIMSIIGGILVSIRCQRSVNYYLVFMLRDNKLRFGCYYSVWRATGILWLGRFIAILPVVLVCCYSLLCVSCFYLPSTSKPDYPFWSISPLISVLSIICCFEVYFISFYYLDLFFDHCRF